MKDILKNFKESIKKCIVNPYQVPTSKQKLQRNLELLFFTHFSTLYKYYSLLNSSARLAQVEEVLSGGDGRTLKPLKDYLFETYQFSKPRVMK